MARKVTLRSQFDLKRDSSVEDTFPITLADKSVTHYAHQVYSLTASTTNQAVGFPTGLTSPTYGMVYCSGGTMTYSVNTTQTHHRLEDGGMAMWHGRFTSLCLSNNSTTTAVTATTIIAG